MRHALERLHPVHLLLGICLGVLLIGGWLGAAGTLAQAPEPTVPPTSATVEAPAEKPTLAPLDAVPAERPQPGQGEPTPAPQPTPAPVEARSSRFEEKLETIQEVDEADMSTRQRIENWDRPAQAAPPVVASQIVAPPITAPQVVAPQQAITPPPRGVGAWYTVQPGDSLSRIASQYNLSVFTLVQANALPNPNLIRVGQQIWLPGASATAGVVAITTPASSPVGCPANTTPAGIAAWLAANSGQAVNTALAGCGIDGEVLQPAAGGDGLAHVVLILDDTVSAGEAGGRRQILVYDRAGGEAGLLFDTVSVGEVEILAAEDVNADGRQELVWQERYCSPYRCYNRLAVAQWTGERYQPWIEAPPNVVEGQYAIKDVLPGGGREILVHAYHTGASAAGDRRLTTTIYASAAGGPFAPQATETHRLADCFFYQMAAVERLLPSAALAQLPTPAVTAAPTPTPTPAADATATPEAESEYAAAIAAYEALLATRQPVACLSAPNELSELRDFVGFRLVVLSTAAGDLEAADGFLSLLASPGLRALAERFVAAYEAGGDLDQACAAVATLAEADPQGWAILADWGLPSLDFNAETLCRYRR